MFLGVVTSFRRVGGSSTSHQSIAPALMTVDLEEDEHADLGELETAHLVSGRVSGRVLVNGEPTATQVALQITQTRGRSTRSYQLGQFLTDPDGNFSTGELPPGSYRLIAWQPKGSTTLLLQDRNEFPLQSGETFSREFQLIHQVLRIQLLEADGKTPIADKECSVSGDRFFHRDATTDKDGWLVLDPAPIEEVWVHLKDGDRIGPAEMPEGEMEAKIELLRPSDLP